MKMLPDSTRPTALRAVLGLALLLAAAACDEGGTTTTCEDMPIIERHGEGGAVDPTTDEDYEAWRARAIREGEETGKWCVTPSGDFKNFVRE